MSNTEVVLITGANTGIGYQIVRALYSSDKAYDIIVAGRSTAKVQDAIKAAEVEFPSVSNRLYPLQVDIEYDESISKVFEEVQSKFGRVDALVNNAGTQLDPLLAAGKMTEREMWNQSWNINTVGTQVMTTTFVPLLLQSSNPRIIFMTSGTSILAGTENMALPVNHYPPKGWPKDGNKGFGIGVPAYRSAKTGMNMMMREWHRLLHEDGVKVWCISPGFLATGLGGRPDVLKGAGAADPSVAGPFVRSVLDGSRDSDVGKIIMRDDVVQAW